MIGFIGTTFTLFLSAIQEYFPDLKGIMYFIICIFFLIVCVILGFKVGINGLFLVVEVLITVLYWGLYFIDTKLIHDEDRWTETGHVPPIFMDTAAHLIPVIAMSTEFLFSRTSKRNLYENRIVHLFAVVIFTFGYFVWILYLFNDTQHFPYPFLRMISAPARVAFTVFSSVLGVFVYGVITYAYSKYHATEGDLPVLAEEFYDETDEDEE